GFAARPVEQSTTTIKKHEGRIQGSELLQSKRPLAGRVGSAVPTVLIADHAAPRRRPGASVIGPPPPNGQAQQPGRPGGLHIWENLEVPAVCCSAWFGVLGSPLRCLRR